MYRLYSGYLTPSCHRSLVSLLTHVTIPPPSHRWGTKRSWTPSSWSTPTSSQVNWSPRGYTLRRSSPEWRQQPMNRWDTVLHITPCSAHCSLWGCGTSVSPSLSTAVILRFSANFTTFCAYSALDFTRYSCYNCTYIIHTTFWWIKQK